MAPITVPHPTRKKLRPSSAAAKLQSHHVFSTPLYGASKLTDRPVTAAQGLTGVPGGFGLRPKTQASGPRSWTQKASPQEQATEQAKNQRRSTLAAVDGIADSETAQKAGTVHPNIGTLLKGKIEEKINIETLDHLKKAFEDADSDKSGQLEQEEFKELLKRHLNLPSSKDAQIDALFQKIDWSSEGSISWDEFCTYMQLEYAEKEDSSKRAKEVAFHLPAKITGLPHRDPVLRINSTTDGSFIACSQDGVVSFWSAAMEMKRTRSVRVPTGDSGRSTKWITDFILMPQYNKIIVGTGDREMQFFDVSSFEPYCQISSLESVPLNLAYCATGHDECLLLYGDGQGCVNIITIHSAGECLRMWKKGPKSGGIASVGLKTVAQGPNTKFTRWMVHGDWVQQLKYYHELRQVISCSNNENTALVIGCTDGSTHVEQQLKEIKDPAGGGGAGAGADKSKPRLGLGWAQPRQRLPVDQHVFKVYKGVKCFDFCKQKMVLITGGMDRIVRLWNPYVPGKAIGMLRGHNAPIFHLFIASEENRIFSISTDKCIKVWDIQDHTCLLTIRPKSHKIRGDLTCCCYSSISKTLAVSTEKMNGLQLKLRPVLHADIVITHKEPIHACVYNSSLKQVITCSDASVIKLWDFETGSSIFEYGEAHGDAAITCLSLDNTNRRLISGGRDGSIKIWNYNNGHCLRTMQKESGNEEICSLTYVEMNKNRYVVAVGWDKKINVYSDSTDDDVHHIQHPLPKWGDKDQVGHKEDILSVAQCPPNLLATSSYDGEVIVWNLVSGHVFCRLNVQDDESTDADLWDGDRSISKVLFLNARKYSKDAASLVASGPRGCVHMWNVFHGGKLLSKFPAIKLHGGCVSCMEVTKQNTTLFTSDSNGFIFVWNITDYCSTGDEDQPPELLTTWRGHVEHVTSLVLIEEHKILLSSSLDCTVRLWTYDGEYIGTFGQPDWWDIYNKSTYQHPMVPYDVLVDPQSLPDHPVIDGKHSTQQVINEDAKKTEKGRPATPTQLQYGRQQFFVDDRTIAEQLREKHFNKGTGKRLRHEKNRPVYQDRGGPSEFQMLICYGLEPTPQPEPPTTTLGGSTRPDHFTVLTHTEETTHS